MESNKQIQSTGPAQVGEDANTTERCESQGFLDVSKADITTKGESTSTVISAEEQRHN